METVESVALQRWLKKIESFHPKEIDMGLERIIEVARYLDCLDFSCPVISVAGTNGKGSCVETLRMLGMSHGLRVGTYTSPHLFRFNERIRIDDTCVTDELLISCFEKIEQCLENLEQTITLSFFEYTTLAALMIFKKANLDLLLLEVGLGGRLDAVNIIDADIAIITSIGIDHEAWLGNTRESVALEKAGIARIACPIVVGDTHPPENLKEQLDKVGAKYLFRDENFSLVENDTSIDFRVQDFVTGGKINFELEKSKLFLAPDNILCALQAFSCLCTMNHLVMHSDLLVQACYQSRLIGRFQLLPLAENGKHAFNRIIFDLTHNPAGAKFFAQQLTSFANNENLGKVVAVFGVMKDKDIDGILSALVDLVDFWVLCELDSERSASTTELTSSLEAIKPAASAYTCTSVEQAMQWCFDEGAMQASSLLVFGSFFTVAPAMQFVRKRGLMSE